jgi:hypothetical protein
MEHNIPPFGRQTIAEWRSITGGTQGLANTADCGCTCGAPRGDGRRFSRYPCFTNQSGEAYTDAPSAFKTAVENLGLNAGRTKPDQVSFHSISTRLPPGLFSASGFGTSWM